MQTLINLVNKKFWLSCLLVFLLGSLAVLNWQSHPDVLFFLYNMEAISKGKLLYIDILDINSPLAYYYNYPAIIVANLLQISSVTTLKIMTVLLHIPVFILFIVIKNGGKNDLYHQNRQLQAGTLFLFSIMLFSGWNFGQREHLLVLLASPYLFLRLAIANNVIIKSNIARFLCGVLATLGILLKPHFVFSILLVEILIFLSSKRGRFIGYTQPEYLGIFSTLAFFIITSVFLFPNYWELFLIGLKTYSGFRSLSSPIFNLGTISLVICVISHVLISISKSKFQQTFNLLLCIVIGSWIGLVWQQKGFPHHIYPIQIASSMYLAFLIWALTVSRPQNLGKIVISLKILAIFTVAINFSISILYSVKPLMPIGENVVPYSLFLKINKTYAEKGSIAIIATELYPETNAQQISGASLATHFSVLWFLPGLYSAEDNIKKPFPYRNPSEMGEIEKTFFNTILEDLKRNNPELIYIKSDTFKAGFLTTTFDYEEYYSQDSRFTTLMKNYNLISTQYGYNIYLKEN